MGESSARALLATISPDFELLAAPRGSAAPDGPLGWAGYDESRERARERTGEDESVLCVLGRVGGEQAVLVAFEFGFMGGSLGRDSGQRVVAAFERARELRVPVVSLVASGGSRLQEGVVALTQLQAIARACLLARRERIPHIAVARHPTTGGMWASLVAGADVVLGLAGADVAFGGSRVRGTGDVGKPFTAEGKAADGQVDQLVGEQELPEALGLLVRLLHPRGRQSPPAEAEVPAPLGHQQRPGSGWDAVQRARSERRPHAREYLDAHFDVRFELSGNRAGGVDAGMRCGVGERNGRTVVFAAQTGTANTPAGFRTAARVLRLADQLALPALTLVDTPGADNGAEAERAGIGPALAELFGTVADVRVPVTTLVIGEGGSGGALALAAPERTWITPDAYFAVLAPESAAAVLRREDIAELAESLRLRPQDLQELGLLWETP